MFYIDTKNDDKASFDVFIETWWELKLSDSHISIAFKTLKY